MPLEGIVNNTIRCNNVGGNKVKVKIQKSKVVWKERF